MHFETFALQDVAVQKSYILQEQFIGTYVCSQKHNYIPYITFTITTVQLHVSAVNVGHFRLYMKHRTISYIYTWVGVQFVGWGGCEISFCVCKSGVDRVYLGGVVKISFMSTINYIYRLLALVIRQHNGDDAPQGYILLKLIFFEPFLATS